MKIRIKFSLAEPNLQKLIGHRKSVREEIIKRKKGKKKGDDDAAVRPRVGRGSRGKI